MSGYSGEVVRACLLFHAVNTCETLSKQCCTQLYFVFVFIIELIWPPKDLAHIF